LKAELVVMAYRVVEKEETEAMVDLVARGEEGKVGK
tara:strand:+ start:1159 stop:1266 length:108 start_codon:yes stop_codon:yes gene_type:complete